MLVSDKLGLIFVHVPKTGGKSIVATLSESTDDIRRFRGIAQFAHLPASQGMSRYDDWRRYRSFAVVRNPWDRMVSAYAYGTSHKVSFEEFVSGDLDFMRNPKWQLTKPQVYWIRDDNGRRLINDILRYETLARDFAVICPSAVALKHINSSEHRPYREYYTTQTREAVAKMFADDIREFGYSFE